MTWNVRYFGQATGGLRSTEGNLRRAAEAIAAQAAPPQVVLLQEVEGVSLRAGLGPVGQADRLRGLVNGALHRAGHDWRYRLHYTPAHRYGLPAGPALYTTGLAALVAEPLEVVEAQAEEVTHVRLPAFAAWKQRRWVVHLRLRVPGGAVLDVFHTHLSLPAFLEEGPPGAVRLPARMGWGSNQHQEIGRLLEVIALRRRAPETVIVAGDLNSLPGSPVLEALAAEGGLVDISGAPRSAGTAHFWRWQMHLDHLLAAPALADEAAAGPFWAIDDRDSPFFGLSDHAPKQAVLWGLRPS